MPVLKRSAYIISAMGLLIASGCSDETEDFHAELKKAEEAMNELKLDDALLIYDDLLEDLGAGSEYSEGRSAIVSDLHAEASSMLETVEDIELDYEEAIEQINGLDPSLNEFEDYYETLTFVEGVQERFEGFTQLDMYEELETEAEKLEEVMENEIIARYKEEAEVALQNEDMSALERSIEELSSLESSAPNYVSEEMVVSLENEAEELEERYVTFPTEVEEWGKTIVNSERGLIEVAGVQDDEGQIELYIYYHDDFRYQAEQISVTPLLIFADGETVDNSNIDYTFYEDKTVQQVRFNTNEDQSLENLQRINVSVPSVDEDDIAVEFEENELDGALTIPGKRSVADLHRPSIDWTTEKYDVEIDRLKVLDNELEISGEIIPNEDGEVPEFSSIYNPETGEYNSVSPNSFMGTNSLEIYEGTQKPFEFTHSFNSSITEHHSSIGIVLFDEKKWFDLHTGEEYEPDEPAYLYELNKDPANNYEEHFNAEDQEDFISENEGLLSPQSVLFRGSGTSDFDLMERFETLEVGVEVQGETVGVDYGSTEIEFRDDEEEVLHEVTVEEDHELEHVEVNVSGVENLEIGISQDSGDEGNQHIIFEEPILNYQE
ncbi:hypothetical protein [Salsuginibacillus kocurii]|uniref:hypothetical protein n=1 Tax=Salsuginibacillus kocurii TaxID=427078 RepID=UPI000374F329|nr:hypothetical protein [Salsuginibacillus kocurii]